MGLGTWGKIGYALQGALTGVAANIEKEEERREKKSNTILAGIIKNADTAMELSNDTIAKKKKFDSQVEELKGRTYIDPISGQKKNITESQAIYAINTYGDKLAEKLANNEIAFASEGKVIRTPPSMRGKLPNPLEMEEDKENFLFYKGRTQKATGDAVREAEAMGYSTEGYPVYTLPTTSGVQEVAGVGNYTRSEQVLYEFSGTGELIKPFKQVTLTNKTNPNEVKTFNVDLVDGTQVEVGKDTIKAPNLNAGKVTGIDDIGAVMIPGENQYVPLFRDGKPVKAFQMENGQIRVESEDGTPGEVIDIEGAQLFGVKMQQATGTNLNDFLNFSKVIGVKDFQEANVKFLELSKTVSSVNERVGYMMKLNAEIGDAGYNLGGFLTTLTNSTIKNVQSAGAFLSGFAENESFQGTSEEAQIARYNYVENNRNTLKTFVDSAEQLLAGAKDAVEERALRMSLLEAEAILLAYDAAKATGDTRISNQDFDAFIKTVRGTSVKDTFNKLERLHKRTIDKYESNLVVVSKLAKAIPIEDIPEGTRLRQYIQNAQVQEGEPLHPNTFRAQFKVIADEYRPKTKEVPTITTQDFSKEVVEVDGQRVLRVTMQDGEVLTLKNPRYLTASDEDIKAALQKRAEAKANQ